MRRRASELSVSDRAGNAGIIATFVIAFAGIAIGAISAYISEFGAAAQASRTGAMYAALREDPNFDREFRAREKIVQQVLAGDHLERLPTPAPLTAVPAKPKIFVVFDDVGIDRRAFERTNSLPGPITLSFLPYAKDVRVLSDTAGASGNEIMLHLPMEPQGESDPGPRALRSDMAGAAFLSDLEWNLSQLDNYVGVNNHMGSKLTANEAAMKTVLAYLKERDLFFLDSVTTSQTVAREAGAMVGAKIVSRDVFIDASPSDPAAIRRQLRLVERIARETGYAIAIGHPRKTTLDVMGPWLASAPARGFDLAPISDAVAMQYNVTDQQVLAAAPTLRL